MLESIDFNLEPLEWSPGTVESVDADVTGVKTNSGLTQYHRDYIEQGFHDQDFFSQGPASIPASIKLTIGVCFRARIDSKRSLLGDHNVEVNPCTRVGSRLQSSLVPGRRKRATFAWCLLLVPHLREAESSLPTSLHKPALGFGLESLQPGISFSYRHLQTQPRVQRRHQKTMSGGLGSLARRQRSRRSDVHSRRVLARLRMGKSSK